MSAPTEPRDTSLSLGQLKVMSATRLREARLGGRRRVEHGRTAAFGGPLARSETCANTHFADNSCHSRPCPKRTTPERLIPKVGDIDSFHRLHGAVSLGAVCAVVLAHHKRAATPRDGACEGGLRWGVFVPWGRCGACPMPGIARRAAPAQGKNSRP